MNSLAKQPHPWTATGMQPRRDWVFEQVRNRFRRFIEQDGRCWRWLSPPAANADPDWRKIVLTAFELGGERMVVAYETKDQETDRVWGLRQGAKDYITKPVSEADLMEKINAVMAAA